MRGARDSAEVVMNKIDRKLMAVVLNFLREGVGEPRHATVEHADVQVLAFDVRRRHVRLVGITEYLTQFRADESARTVLPALFLRWLSVVLDEHSVVNVNAVTVAEGCFD